MQYIRFLADGKFQGNRAVGEEQQHSMVRAGMRGTGRGGKGGVGDGASQQDGELACHQSGCHWSPPTTHGSEGWHTGGGCAQLCLCPVVGVPPSNMIEVAPPWEGTIMPVRAWGVLGAGCRGTWEQGGEGRGSQPHGHDTLAQ